MSSGWWLRRWSSLDLNSPQRVACLLYSLFRILGALRIILEATLLHNSVSWHLFWPAATPQPHLCTSMIFYPMFHSPPGVRIGLFTPDRAFDMVTKSQIQKLRPPSLKLVDHVTIEMLAMVRDVAGKVRRPKSNLTTRDHLQLLHSLLSFLLLEISYVWRPPLGDFILQVSGWDCLPRTRLLTWWQKLKLSDCGSPAWSWWTMSPWRWLTLPGRWWWRWQGPCPCPGRVQIGWSLVYWWWLSCLLLHFNHILLVLLMHVFVLM